MGGMENFVLGLGREQVSRGNDVRVLTLNRNFSNNSYLPGNGEIGGINIQRVPFIGSKRYPIAVSAINHIKDCDILHVHGIDFFIDYFAAARFLHRKSIVLHTHGGYFHTKKWALLKKLYFNIVTRLVLKGCDKVIACSKNDYKLFSMISGKVALINNGVDIEKFLAIKKNIEPGRLLYVGRISENKKIDNLIMTADRLNKKGFNIKLIILGPDRDGLKIKLQSLARSLGLQHVVSFLGEVPEGRLLEELASAHVFVFASEYEGFGMSAIEAMSSGTVCVLNNINAFREIVTHGKTGFITDFGNVESAAVQISAVLSMDHFDYERISSDAKISALKYSWKKIAQDIMDCYS
jgi:alpha-1,3-mannosyltransferase